MADSKFIKFFDKTGVDMNLEPSQVVQKLAYTGATQTYTSYSGKIRFDQVSVDLIDSQQIYLLQEVTGPTTSYQLRRIPGTFILTAGSPFINGVSTDFADDLQVGDTVRVINTNYTVSSISGATSMLVTPTPPSNITTDDVYRYDYLSYNALRTSPDTFNETINLSFSDSGTTGATGYFIYNVDYSEDIPFIEKDYEIARYLMDNGSGDSIDPLTGRVLLASVETEPTRINLGFSLSDEQILEKDLYLDIKREYQDQIAATPTVSGSNITFMLSGTTYLNYFLTDSVFYLQGVTAPGATVTFYNQRVTLKSVNVLGPDTYLTFENSNYDQIVGALNYSQYRIFWENTERLATIGLYGETIAEDERFRLVLENFGRQVNFDQEYIFRDSDINEDLPDYKLLNQKRKELLLAGDSIYPYMGSYKALINIINFFGYYDLRIKEYFLNVNTRSSNYGKYLHLLVPKNEEQRALVKSAWQIVPSRIYKKTSLFGLFYDLNRTTGDYDIYGTPEVEDAFDYSPEEVLIKLFGLKEILKRYFLPLNARIYDITGEGIYFERIRLDSWSDSVNSLYVNLGVRPQFRTFPANYSYVTDIRRIDDYYQNVFVAQGLTGFLGATSSDPYLNSIGYTGAISSLFGTAVTNYGYFLDFATGPSGEYEAVVDDSWEFMPPGISNPAFNQIASRLLPLSDDQNILAGAPILLEAYFDISWQESFFTWSQLAILGPTGAPLNINIWTWESIGRGENIEMRWTVEKGGANGFYYDSLRQPIDSFAVSVTGATAFSLPARITVDVLGGSIVNVNLVSSGYGYTSPPTIYVPAPDQTGGTLATISSTVVDGYVTSLTFTGGSGYSYPPTITVSPPTPTYETATKIYHAVNLPYAGEYQIGLYLYDITNNFSMAFQTFTVKSKNVTFTSTFRRSTSERTWQDFSVVQPSLPPPGASNNLLPSGARLISWDEVTGPWYYPIHVESSWEEAEVSWETLNFSSYNQTDLYNYVFNTEILEIDRNARTVLLSGDQTGSLSDAITLNVGDYLFFTRDSSTPIQTDLPIYPDSFNSILNGYDTTIFSPSPVYFTLPSIGATVIDTQPWNLTGYLNSGDFVLIDSLWYTVDAVGATQISVLEPTGSTVSAVQANYLPSSLESQFFYFPPYVPMNVYSRLLISDVSSYSTINPSTDFYVYVDGLTSSGGAFPSITVKGDESSMKKLIYRNSSFAAPGGETLYSSWGIFSGTYALQIKNISLVGGNTQFRLDDPNKELYYLDSNFTPRLADYDVDYAEYRSGPISLTYQAADEFTWSEGEHISWYTIEFHGGVLCGYVIPFVSPSGNITVDEFPTFDFSGDISIDNTKAGLQVAISELTSSTNEGISKYDYSLLPQDELYLEDSFGASLTVSSPIAPGAGIINVNTVPGNITVPAELSVTILSGQVTAVSIDNPGFGYYTPPTITVTPPGGTGTSAVITCSVLNGIITSTLIIDPGSNYTSTPNAQVEVPPGHKPYDNAIWTGYEWLNVNQVDPNVFSGCNLYVDTVNYAIGAGDNLLLPYDYHKQILRNSTLLQSFYFCIHATAKNPSSEMLSYIFFGNGVEGEWIQHPDRSYTYPLRNSILFSSISGYDNLSQDYLYNTWVYWGSDYPPLSIPPEYQSNVMSYQSRVPYLQTLQSAFSFIDTVISENQEKVPQFTPVVFSYDSCRIPGKKNPIWTIKDEDHGDIEIVSRSKNVMWNFTRTGNFTVSLQLEDSNGNVSTGIKKSFLVVGDPQQRLRRLAPAPRRQLLRPVRSQLAVSANRLIEAALI